MDLVMNVLESKLNAVLDMPTEDFTSRPTSPSLASTSSEALQFHLAVYRKPLIEEHHVWGGKESEYLPTLFWGDEPTQRVREEQFEEEREAVEAKVLRYMVGACAKSPRRKPLDLRWFTQQKTFRLIFQQKDIHRRGLWMANEF
jgi:hypothetical protein